MVRLVWTILLVLRFTATVPGQTSLPAPEEKPPTLGEEKAKAQIEALADLVAAPKIDAKKVSDIIDVSLKNKDLVVTTTLAPIDQAVVRAPGLAGLTKISISAIGDENREPPLLRFQLDNINFNTDEAISINTSLSDLPGQLMFSQDHNRVDDVTHTVQLIQATRELGEGEYRVKLYVQITAEPPVKIERGADNIVDLRRKYPAEVAKYVDPIFRVLRVDGLLAKMDPALAWQVFADAFTPEPATTQKVAALLKKLDADSFQDREAATRELNELGQPAALALMRIERKGLSDEQLGRLDAFFARYKTVPDDEAERLRRDADFLLDCLFADPKPIRRAALAELNKLTGRTIEFDIDASSEQRLAAIGRLRDSLGGRGATTAKIKG